MNNLEKYLDQVIEQRPVVYEVPAAPEEPPTTNFLESLRRRWYIVPAAALLLSVLALPAIWLLLEPHYIVEGAVRVAPAVPGILSNEPDRSGMGSYREFVNTQATMLTSNPVLQSIADDLVDRNLSFFSGKPQTRLERWIAKVLPARKGRDPVTALRVAMADKTIAVGHHVGTELISVAMKSTNTAEAKQIVDSFLRNYQAVYGSTSSQQENENLRVLEAEQSQLLGKIKAQRQEIRRLADEYGTTVLDSRQDMEMRRTAALLTDLTSLEARRIILEADISLLEQKEKADMTPEQLLAARREHVNADLRVKELEASVVEMERELLVMQQTLVPGNPVLGQRQATLNALQETLENRRKELEQEFDAGLDDRLKAAAGQEVAKAQAQLQQIKAHENGLRQVLNAQDTTTRQIGKTNLDIQDKQFQLQLDEEVHGQISRRIKEIEMERQRRPRITTAYWAQVQTVQDRRVKLMVAALLGSLGCGVLLAFLRDKTDKTLQTPDDMTRQLDLPIIGTTTSSRTIKPALFAEQIAGDYQMIRTNLGLLNNGGMPKKLVVSSAGMREGKTTFAVNLATSLAKSGKKVLLIDGDLRKPDVAYMLNVANGSGGLQNVLLGEDPREFIAVQPATGLHVLPANPRHLGDIYELLTSATAAEQIERLTREYDHIIIDSPPALIFPDALVLAKLADAVILVGFAGQTTAPDLKETKERFARIRVRVLGAVLSNVPLDQTFNRYGYTYRYRARGAHTARGRRAKRLLLPTQGAGDDRAATDA